MDKENKAPLWTAEQLKLIEWRALPEKMRSPKTMELLGKELGVTRWTLWNWSTQPGFAEAVREKTAAYAAQYLNGEIPQIMDALVKAAKKGDYHAIRLALEITGLYVSRKDITSGGEVIQGLIINIDDGDD